MSPLSSSAPRLGDLERAVMNHLWDGVHAAHEGLTVRQVRALFEGERELAYTTVMTVLDRLARKGLVDRERDGRAWRYRPADTREALTAQTMRLTFADVAASDRRAALLHFFDGATPEEIADVRAALDTIEAQDSPAKPSRRRR